MYRVDDFTIMHNAEGMIISNGETKTQIYIGPEREYFKEVPIPSYMIKTKKELEDRAKSRVADKMFPNCRDKESSKLALDNNYDGLLLYFENNKENHIVKKMKTMLHDATVSIEASYKKYIEEYKHKNRYIRKEIPFTIGSNETVHKYSFGSFASPDRKLDIALDILENVRLIDEFGGLDTLSSVMNFGTYFGYDYSDCETLDNITKAIVEMGKGLEMKVPEESNAVRTWISYGVTDPSLLEKGYIPEEEISNFICEAEVEWKTGEIETLAVGFYADGEDPEDDIRDEDVFYHFKYGDEVIGDHGDFVIKSFRWVY
jgi:hypothetical protein